MRLKWQKGDLLAAGLVVLLAALVALIFLPHRNAPENAQVQIYLDGSLIRTLSLRQDAVVEVTGAYSNTVEVRDGKVAVTASDCPGEDCVHSGWTGSTGRSVICLPNRMEVRVSGGSDVDYTVG